MTNETLAITYGLASALTWGAGDFSGGFATKRGKVLMVILLSQLLGALLLFSLALFFAEQVPEVRHLIFGAMAGISGVLGLTALYKGLALGRMGIVAPLSAVITALLPMTFSFLFEGLPRLPQVSGFAVAIVSVWLLSYPGRGLKIKGEELRLSLTAGVCFGLFFIFIDQASTHSILWPLVAARIASIILISAILVTTRKIGAPSKRQVPFIVLAGILDAAGNAFFALAAHIGRLDVSAVLSSLYPGSTVLLAWLILKEKLLPQQWAGVAAAIAALALIAA